MPNVVAVVQDDRVRRQIEQYLGELGMEDLQFATFGKLQEFEQMYCKEKAVPEPPPPPPPPPPVEEGMTPPEPVKAPEPELVEPDPRFFGQVHVMIFALDTINEKSSTWIDKTRLSLKKFGFFPKDSKMRWILLKYEDDGVSKLDLLHPALDDLIYLPMDRLIFLQKMQILLNLPKLEKPKFLFNQAVVQDIEISKIVKVDRLSDVAMAIRNPVPLKRGMSAHFYLQLPNEKNRLELKGKVLRSEPHPEFPGQYLVYFTYFGINKTDLSQIRRSLSKAQHYQSLLTDDREAVRYQPTMFSSANESASFGIAVIDPDEHNATTVTQQIQKEMDRVQTVTESSYLLFLHRYLDSGGKDDMTPPKPTDDNELYATPIKFSINVSDMKSLTVEPAPVEGNLFLGHPAETYLSGPDRWMSMLQDKESKLIAEESVNLAAQGRTLVKLLNVQDATGDRRALTFKFLPGSENLVSVEVSAASIVEVMAKSTSTEETKALEALIVDSTFVPEDPSAWIEGLRTRAAQVGLVKEPKDLKFFVLSDRETKAHQNWLNTPDLLGLLYKPVDYRHLMFLLSEYLPNKNTLFNFDNLGWSQPGVTAHLSKGIQLEALSEFGATLKSKSQIAPGTILYLRKSIFDNAPNNCLAARIYHCEEHSSEKGFFQIHATYFGINDAFLKFARTWIRENYAHQKSKEGNG